MKRNFEAWISTFKDSIATWNYYVDFNKVYRNVDAVKVELHLLNSLINSKDIENDFKKLVADYPKVLRAIPILVAKREHEIKITEIEGSFNFNFDKPNYSINEYCLFMKKSGLFDLLQNHLISDLTDYVKGIEVGMDTNGRKNRTGHIMEDMVEGYILKAGFIKDSTYFKEMYKSDIERLFSIDLSSISNDGKSEKRFDFVLKTPTCVYAVETNFYGSSGSKLNETARSYELLAMQSKNIKGFKFVWFTDGNGWHSAKNNLRQTFDVLDDLYCINDLENGIISEKIK